MDTLVPPILLNMKKEFNDKIKLRKDIDSIFNVINMSISNYEKKSIVNKVNTHNNNVKLDYHFIEIFSKSKEIWESTKGYFDLQLGEYCKCIWVWS